MTTSDTEPGSAARRAGTRRPGPRTSRTVLVVPALLVVALVLLVVGLISSTSAWLAASLVASVLAAVLLVAERVVQARRSGRSSVARDTATRTADTDAADTRGADTRAAGTSASGDPVPPVDLDAPAIDPDDPQAVWVVDGRPRYHTRDCATIATLDSEPIPRSQALEDGFVACSLCDPGTADTPQHAST
ncbi:hypothetical protein ACXR2U_12945 [Jatrophihabitans sp. YIM 134969]